MQSRYKVEDMMTSEPIVTSPVATLRTVADLMNRHKVGSVLVVHSGSLVGIITERDLVRKAMTRSLDVDKALATNIMTPAAEMVVTTPQTDIFAAIEKMNDSNVRHLPVVQGADIVGLITLKDILRIQPELYELIADKYELLPGKLA